MEGKRQGKLKKCAHLNFLSVPMIPISIFFPDIWPSKLHLISEEIKEDI